MSGQEYFGDWYRYIDQKALNLALSYVVRDGEFVPEPNKVFRAFRSVSPKDVAVVCMGSDPFYTPGVATGLAFANSADTPEDALSPSLKVIREAAVDYTRQHNKAVFDPTLESWAKQGVLMLNTALTTKPGVSGAHVLYWKPFMKSFIESFSHSACNIAWVLFGNHAKAYRKHIDPLSGQIFESEHPAYLARVHEPMSTDLFRDVAEYALHSSGTPIKWYVEEECEDSALTDCNFGSFHTD